MTSYGDIHKWHGYWKIASHFQWNSWKLRLQGRPSNLDRLVEQTPVEWKNVSPEPYPWKKSYSWKNKTFFGPTFPFPWSPGLSSLAALGRQLSCQSRRVKSCPSESLVPPQFHSFRGNPVRIYIPLRILTTMLSGFLGQPGHFWAIQLLNHSHYLLFG